MIFLLTEMIILDKVGKSLCQLCKYFAVYFVYITYSFFKILGEIRCIQIIHL